jgi:hypothetical protein
MSLRALLGLLPVFVFLVALVGLDSFKLVRPRLVLGTMALGGVAALIAYFANGWLLELTQLPLREYSRYVAPLLEEMLKGAGPSVAVGRDTALLREILDGSARQIDRELTNQPAVEPAITLVI